MITGWVNGDVEVSRRLRRFPESMRADLRKTVQGLAIKLQRKVMAEKLSGQVLNVKTGTLRRSIDQAMVDDPEGVFGVVSTNLSYARRHEYGFQGQEQVKQHLRTIKQAWGKQLKEPISVTVSAHARRVDYKAHPFLRPSLEEMRATIKHDIERSVTRSGGA